MPSAQIQAAFDPWEIFQTIETWNSSPKKNIYIWYHNNGPGADHLTGFVTP
jgi:hypothetical protein